MKPTDQELLQDCRSAFVAIMSGAPECRKLMKKWGLNVTLGTRGDQQLAAYMVVTLRSHLESPDAA